MQILCDSRAVQEAADSTDDPELSQRMTTYMERLRYYKGYELEQKFAQEKPPMRMSMSNFQAISRERYAHQRWQHSSDYAFAAADPVVALTAAELPKAAMSLTIAFVAQAEVFVPVAVLGLRPEKSLSVAADGSWIGNYIPAVLRSYPFRLAPTSDGQQVLCIDESSGLITHEPEGEHFFSEGGQPSAALQDVLNTVNQTEHSRLAAVAACAVLQKHNLIRPWSITVKSGTGVQQVAGLFQIDKMALNQLSSEALHEFQQVGALEMAYCQLLSMQHLPQLCELNEAHAKAAELATQEVIARSNPNLGLQSTDKVTLPQETPKVLLVTFDWSTLCEMPHLVKQAGFQVDVLCPSNNPAIRNSFYDHWIDSGATMETLIAVLLKLVGDNVYQHILIGDDPILWKIYREKIVALSHLLPIRNESALPILNKVGFAEHCRNHGIPSPKFVSVHQKDGATEALKSLGLPIVVKENYSNGGKGVWIFKDESAYYTFMEGYDYSEPLLAQQFIAGEQVGAEALFKNGKLLQYASSLDIEPTSGPSTKRRYMPNDEKIGDIIRKLGQSALLHGFANISIMQESSSGNYYLFEADPRPTKWVPYARWFGGDFVPAFKAFMTDGDGYDATDANSTQDIVCWEVEYFPSHAAKLLNEGRTTEAILHLLDFMRNYRYTIYDPVLLEDKLECMRKGLTFAQ